MTATPAVAVVPARVALPAGHALEGVRIGEFYCGIAERKRVREGAPLPQDIQFLLERVQKDDPELTEVNISGRLLGDNFMALLAGSLCSNTHVRSVIVLDNGTTSRGVISLCKAVVPGESGVTSINLGENPLIGRDGVLALVNQLKVNPFLVSLYLDHHCTNKHEKDVIHEELSKQGRERAAREYAKRHGQSERAILKAQSKGKDSVHHGGFKGAVFKTHNPRRSQSNCS